MGETLCRALRRLGSVSAREDGTSFVGVCLCVAVLFGVGSGDTALAGAPGPGQRTASKRVPLSVSLLCFGFDVSVMFLGVESFLQRWIFCFSFCCLCCLCCL